MQHSTSPFISLCGSYYRNVSAFLNRSEYWDMFLYPLTNAYISHKAKPKPAKRRTEESNALNPHLGKAKLLIKYLLLETKLHCLSLLNLCSYVMKQPKGICRHERGREGPPKL